MFVQGILEIVQCGKHVLSTHNRMSIVWYCV